MRQRQAVNSVRHVSLKFVVRFTRPQDPPDTCIIEETPHCSHKRCPLVLQPQSSEQQRTTSSSSAYAQLCFEEAQAVAREPSSILKLPRQPWWARYSGALQRSLTESCPSPLLIFDVMKTHGTRLAEPRGFSGPTHPTRATHHFASTGGPISASPVASWCGKK